MRHSVTERYTMQSGVDVRWESEMWSLYGTGIIKTRIYKYVGTPPHAQG